MSKSVQKDGASAVLCIVAFSDNKPPLEVVEYKNL